MCVVLSASKRFTRRYITVYMYNLTVCSSMTTCGSFISLDKHRCLRVIFILLTGVRPDVTEDGLPPVQEPVSRLRHCLALPHLPANVSRQHLRLAHPFRAKTSGRRVPRHQHAALLPFTNLPDGWHPGCGCWWWPSSGLHPLSGGGAGSDGVPTAFGDDGGAAALRLHAAQAEPAAGLRS